MTNENLLRYETKRGNIYRTAFLNYIRFVARHDGTMSSVGVCTLRDADEAVRLLEREIVNGCKSDSAR